MDKGTKFYSCIRIAEGQATLEYMNKHAISEAATVKNSKGALNMTAIGTTETCSYAAYMRVRQSYKHYNPICDMDGFIRRIKARIRLTRADDTSWWKIKEIIIVKYTDAHQTTPMMIEAHDEIVGELKNCAVGALAEWVNSV